MKIWIAVGGSLVVATSVVACNGILGIRALDALPDGDAGQRDEASSPVDGDAAPTSPDGDGAPDLDGKGTDGDALPKADAEPDTGPPAAPRTHGNFFGVGLDYHLSENRLQFNWNGVVASIDQSQSEDWGLLGASGGSEVLNGGPAPVSWGPGRIDVFNFDTHYNLRHGYRDGTVPGCSDAALSPCVDNWGGPPVGVSLTGEPAVTSWGPQRLDVFAASAAAGLYHSSWDSGVGSGWVSAGNPAGVTLRDGGVSAVSSTPGTIDVFALGADNNIYRWTWHGTVLNGSGSWSLWMATQGKTYDGGAIIWQGKPAVASWLPRHFDVMLTDTTGRLFDCGGDNDVAWGDCVYWPSPVTFTHSPAITALGDHRLLVASRGSDGQGWMKLWDFGKDTAPWGAVSGVPLAGASVAVSSW